MGQFVEENANAVPLSLAEEKSGITAASAILHISTHSRPFYKCARTGLQSENR